MNLNAYPEYKESGLPWLGEVPVHWGQRRMKFMFRERVQKGFPDEPLLAATQSKGVVRKEDYGSRTVTATKDFHLLKLVEVGDFVISLRSFEGGIEVAYCRGIISPAYTVLKPTPHACPSYYTRFFKSSSFISSLTLFVTGIREGQNIDYERLSRAFMPLPPIEEQVLIGRFLNWSTSRLERTIRAKRKVIALLTEQKQAIIHRAVTRGLDPSVRLKPSGIPWLGDIPEHWEVISLRMRYSVELGKMLDTKRITGRHSVPYLRNRDVQWDQVLTNELPLMDIPPSEIARYTVRRGDLLVCEGGQVGRSAFWGEQLPVCGFQKALHRVRCLNSSSDCPRFFFYQMHLAAGRGVFSADGNENTIAHLTCEKFRRHRFTFPPFAEQSAIADQLDGELRQFHTAIARLEREIELLREYRTRLVADVVTGKLDVREVALALPEEVVETELEEDAEIDLEEIDA
jgi:type I restriction enzyme S subunit